MCRFRVCSIAESWLLEKVLKRLKPLLTGRCPECFRHVWEKHIVIKSQTQPLHANEGNQPTRKGTSPSPTRSMEVARTRLARYDQVSRDCFDNMGAISIVIDSGLVGSTDLNGRGTTRAEDAQGAPTRSHLSPSILEYTDEQAYYTW